ncbi:hypothetical protein GXW78_04770 [Roseomonas terrae]|jgi:hypothetical protein|uniref:Lipoprotein n=1 Tax=Neoroseomonas terrae TaxID=424799 RepID=A0ABS5ED64_9PROT|nr:hypothetical protein [Neoroseomonas terrae]MBR0648964.1 hypothetical protein [Neoroseomonas terrae]
MHRTTLMALLLATACAEPPPARIVAPSAPLPAPVPIGTPEEQAARRLQRALGQSGQGDPARQTGEPRQAPFDIGGQGQGPVMPDQVSPAFRGL